MCVCLCIRVLYNCNCCFFKAVQLLGYCTIYIWQSPRKFASTVVRQSCIFLYVYLKSATSCGQWYLGGGCTKSIAKCFYRKINYESMIIYDVVCINLHRFHCNSFIYVKEFYSMAMIFSFPNTLVDIK